MSLSDTINAISALGSLVTILVAAVTAIYFLRTRNPDMKEIVRTCVIALVICVLIITGGIYGLHAAFPPVALNPPVTTPPQSSPHPSQVTADPITPVPNPYVNKDTSAQNMNTSVLNDALNGSNGADYQWENDGSATPVNGGQGSSFCGFETDGSYHALSKDPTSTSDFTFCPALQTNFSSFTFEVQMDITCCSQSSGSYGGIFFREQDSQDMYVWTINQNKYSTISIDKSGTFYSLLSNGYIQYFNGGFNQTNTLAVVVNGPQIDFFVNGYYITTAHNVDIPSGAIGVVGGNNSDVVYSNAKVWTS